MQPSRHPKGLWTLSFCEFAGRFTYYGLQSSFVLLLVGAFQLKSQETYVMFGVFAALAFSLPIIGGLIGDHLLRQKNCVMLGTVASVLGNFLMFISGQSFFYTGLAFLIAGMGLSRANNTSLLGSIYQKHPSKSEKEAGFSILYAAMCVGSIIGPISYGIIFSSYDWHNVFLLGGGIELIALFIFVIQRHAFSHASPVRDNRQTTSKKVLKILIPTALMGLSLILLKSPELFNTLFWLLSIAILIYLVLLLVKLPAENKRCLALLLVLILAAMIYFSCDIQISSTLILFVSNHLHIYIFGWQIPSQFYTALEPIFYILFTPAFITFTKGDMKKRNSKRLINHAIAGLLSGGLGFILFSLATQIDQSIYSASLILFGSLFLAIGELNIAPIILSSITYLVPNNYQSTFMGIWWFAISFSYYLGNFIIAHTVHSPTNEFATHIGTYFETFRTICVVIIASAVILALFRPIIISIAPKNLDA